MRKDGDLRHLFRYNLRSWQWTSIETAGSASGVPDSEYCSRTGITGWIEFKQTKIFYVQIKPLQVSWLDRRCRMGGNAFIAVRRISRDIDELWLMKGDQAKALQSYGLNGVQAVSWSGGPSMWNFDEVADILNNNVKSLLRPPQ